MFVESVKDIKMCREIFHSGLRSGQIYGRMGKIRKSSKESTFSFHITNRRHYFRNTREMQGSYLPIYVYAHGKVSTSSSGVTMQSKFWYGMPVWDLLLFYVAAFLIMLCMRVRYDISFPFAALSALVFTLCAALFSIVCSSITLLGNDDRRALEEYLTKNLEQNTL